MFHKIHIQVSSRCFLSCSFCPSSAHNVQHHQMDISLFEHICRSLKHHTQLLALHVLGDPLTIKGLEKYLDCACFHGLQIELTTVGIHLHRLKPLINHRSLKQVNFSLTSFIAAPEFAHWNFESYILPLLDVVVNKPKHLFINLRFWDRQNPKLDALLTILQKHFILKPHGHNRIRICERVFLCLDSLFVWPSFNNPIYQEKGFCLALRSHIAILGNADVVPCCLDYAGNMVLGNLKDQSLESILQSKRARMMYDGFIKGELCEPLCKHCGYIQRFNK